MSVVRARLAARLPPPPPTSTGRSLCRSLAREHTGASLPTIGAEFGGRGHTTVIHACRRTAERIAADPEVGRTVADLSTRLSSDLDVTRPDRPE